MKFTALIATTLLAATAYGVAVPDADPYVNGCHRTGQGCGKRSPYEFTEAETRDPALASKLTARSCGMPGQPCHKLARAAEAAAEALAAPAPEPEPFAAPYVNGCHRVGQGCGKAKRAASALAEAIAKAYADAHPDPEAFAAACGFEADTCSAIKRAAEAEAQVSGCHRVGQGCGKEKREALQKKSAEAWAEAGAYVNGCHRVGQGCG